MVRQPTLVSIRCFLSGSDDGGAEMNLTLTLQPHQAAELQRRASLAGTDVHTLLMQMVFDADSADEASGGDLPYERWRQQFQQWVRAHKTRNPDVDDSRESMYA
jgi:hypothetical protein